MHSNTTTMREAFRNASISPGTHRGLVLAVERGLRRPVHAPKPRNTRRGGK